MGVSPIPPALDTPEFRRSWDRWVTYRRESRKALKPQTASAQLEKLAEVGPAAAAARIERAITNGWQGLFFNDEQARPAAPSLFAETAAEKIARLKGGQP
jgi:hypothetical protein